MLALVSLRLAWPQLYCHFFQELLQHLLHLLYPVAYLFGLLVLFNRQDDVMWLSTLEALEANLSKGGSE